MDLYNRIAKHCIDQGITRQAFAEKLGMSYHTLWCKCHGKSSFTLGEAYALSQLIDINIGELVKLLA